MAFFTNELTDAQALTAGCAAQRGASGPMTTDQMSLELRAATCTVIKEVINRWAASGAVVQFPSGTRPATSRFVSPN